MKTFIIKKIRVYSYIVSIYIENKGKTLQTKCLITIISYRAWYLASLILWIIKSAARNYNNKSFIHNSHKFVMSIYYDEDIDNFK